MGGGKVPDAWDDDWVEKADTRVETREPAAKPAKLSKAERRAKQAEFNRQLWEDAETQNQNFFLSSRGEVPLKSEFKPAMQVLSRKPATAPATSKDTSLGPSQATPNDDDEEDDEEGKTRVLTLEERQLKAQQEREQKQKKYDEARQRLFGGNGVSTGRPTGNTTPPRAKFNGDSRGSSKNRNMLDGRAAPSLAAGPGLARQLYDPGYTAKPDSSHSQTHSRTPDASGRSTPIEQQPVRNPRGPDGSGRGGFGFAHRGGKV
ncbi:MAG: hypothetical protein Q9220_003480 [cf. Caloplaca sp. 1 TL-2023]